MIDISQFILLKGHFAKAIIALSLQKWK